MTKEGLTAVGFLTYESAPAFDRAFRVLDPGPLPLLWFGLYRDAEPMLPPAHLDPHMDCEWEPSLDSAGYHSRHERIKDYIAGGDTYQVNFTMQLDAAFDGDPRRLFAQLLASQPRGYAAYLDTGDHVLCSISPELFFRLSGDRIVCRPMKGTSPRGVTLDDDRRRIQWLRNSSKNRAENIMIVDMIRNDLGRIAEIGSIDVTRLCDIEQYRTLFQMTSTVEARTGAPLSDIFRALFPCASITGAPKIRTMQIISELEDRPRGIYTGCIGTIGPGREAQFNVAIRTVHIDRRHGRAAYGTGGGIVWDSDPEDEYRECSTKALILRRPPPAFQLLETLRWDPGRGFALVDRHLSRIRQSAAFFDFTLDQDGLRDRLRVEEGRFGDVPHRVRVLVGPDGETAVASTPIPGVPFQTDPNPTDDRWSVAVSRTPVDSTNYFLYHKTTVRAVYDEARAVHPDADDVLLWNQKNEVTESTIANVVARIGGDFVTPPVSCGLLAGTFREELLERGTIAERVITIDELRHASDVYVINSVRGWIPVHVLP